MILPVDRARAPARAPARPARALNTLPDKQPRAHLVDRAGPCRSTRRSSKDQLDPVATSIVLNIAEGAGEYRRDEKQRFYRMARRSATETGAILDIIEQRGAAPAALIRSARELLVRVVSMLARLAGA